MMNRFETYFDANYTYSTTQTDNFQSLGLFENLAFVIMSTRENIRLIAGASLECYYNFFLILIIFWAENR